MSFSKVMQNDGFLRDSVNHANFLLFIVLREYACSLSNFSDLDDSLQSFKSKQKIDFYMLLYDMLKVTEFKNFNSRLIVGIRSS